MFYGEYEHTLDDKNRFIVPVRFRDRLEEGCFMTRGLDGCLWIYTPAHYEELLEQSRNLPAFNRNARDMQRMLSATDLKLDKQGRLLIPPTLRQHAGIEPGGDIVIVGIMAKPPRIEVWSATRWAELNARLQAESAEIAENLAGSGISL